MDSFSVYVDRRFQSAPGEQEASFPNPSTSLKKHPLSQLRNGNELHARQKARPSSSKGTVCCGLCVSRVRALSFPIMHRGLNVCLCGRKALKILEVGGGEDVCVCVCGYTENFLEVDKEGI
jgi:hypothetical protein